MADQRRSRFPAGIVTSVLLAGAACLCLQGSPAEAQAAGHRDFQIVESVPEGTLYGQPGIARTKDVWLDMIHHAQHTIDAAVFYIPDKPGHGMSDILDALTQRARADVQVRIVVEQSFLKETGSVLEKLKAVPNVTTAILPGHALTGGILHAKYMVVDSNSVFVGSQNWDWRSWLLARAGYSPAGRSRAGGGDTDHRFQLGAVRTDAVLSQVTDAPATCVGQIQHGA